MYAASPLRLGGRTELGSAAGLRVARVQAGAGKGSLAAGQVGWPRRALAFRPNPGGPQPRVRRRVLQADLDPFPSLFPFFSLPGMPVPVRFLPNRRSLAVPPAPPSPPFARRRSPPCAGMPVPRWPHHRRLPLFFASPSLSSPSPPPAAFPVGLPLCHALPLPHLPRRRRRRRRRRVRTRPTERTVLW